MNGWYDIYNKIESNGWRRQVMAFVAKIPNVPIPEVVSNHYAPGLEWGAGARLSRDYLDFEVYELFQLNRWVQVREEEFLDWLRIQYSL